MTLASIFGGQIPVDDDVVERILLAITNAAIVHDVDLPIAADELTLDYRFGEVLSISANVLTGLADWFSSITGRPLEPAVALINAWAM